MRGNETLYNKWVLGLTVPLLTIACGVYFMISQQGGLRRGNAQAVFSGWGAVALGLFWISFGLAIHFVFFWGSKRSTSRWVTYGMAGTAVLFAASVILVLVYFVRS